MTKKPITHMKGDSLTLSGRAPELGERSPQFIVRDTGLAPKSLSDYGSTTKLISVVPSLDTGVCDAQTRRFNQEAASFSEDVVILTISMDLPFAQRRWCGAAGVERVITLSDHYDASFGLAYGLLIEELRLLNRAVFILDSDNIVRYRQILDENTDHPDYEAALKALKELSGQ